jgi:hypothetical protein
MTTRIIIKPAQSLLKRNQWKFEIRAANGARVDPRDTYNNRPEASQWWEQLVTGTDPVELVIYDRNGNVEERRTLR